MAARQKATKHQLEDGFVIAWDSSEPDEKLRAKLTAIADQKINEIALGLGAGEPAVKLAAPADAPASRRRRRRKPAPGPSRAA